MSTSTSSKTRRPGGGSGSPPNRLPSTRERRPALAALGVLLVAGGALASAWLALQVSDRADYLVIADGRGVVQGAEIDDSDLSEVSLPDDLDGAVPASERDDVIGMHAKTSLLGGTILSPGMVEREAVVDEGFSIISTSFDSGDLSDLADVGSAVLLRVPPADDGNDEPGAVRGTITVLDRPLDEENSGPDGGETTASFMIPSECFDDLSGAIEDGNLVPALAAAEEPDAKIADCAN